MATVILLHLFCWCKYLALLFKGKSVNLFIKNLDIMVEIKTYFFPLKQ